MEGEWRWGGGRVEVGWRGLTLGPPGWPFLLIHYWGVSLSPVAAGIGPFLHSLLLAGPGPAHDYRAGWGEGEVGRGKGGAGSHRQILSVH